jgi:hypothetical protein
VLAGVKFGEQISSDFNFDTTLDAFEALFVLVTGSGFSATLRDVTVALPMCTRCDDCHVDIDGKLASFSDCGVPGSQVLPKRSHRPLKPWPAWRDMGDRSPRQSPAGMLFETDPRPVPAPVSSGTV